MNWVADLASEWEERAEQLAPFAKSAAEAFVDCAEDLRDAHARVQGKLLTLTEAAEVTGYSRGHLGRLVREGHVPNHGRKHAPRVRLGDLPRKKTGGKSDIIDKEASGEGLEADEDSLEDRG